jgi:GT2 family glycosyltransferase
VSETVSCIIPTHARADFLSEALASVLAQTRPPAEVIVVSDVDDPEAEALCRRVADEAAFPVTYLRNERVGGASGSRNTGAAAASGDVFAFLDDDDKWKPGFLESALGVLVDGADGVATWIQMFRGDQVAPGLQIAPGLEARRAASENPGVTGSNFVVRRVAFEAIGGFDEKLLVKNDGDFFFRFLLAGFSYAVNPRAEVLQRKHSSGQLTGRTEFRAQGLEAYLAKHRAVLTLGDRRSIRLSASRIRYHAAASRPAKIRQLVLGAFYSSPASLLASVRNRKTKDFWITDGFGTGARP